MKKRTSSKIGWEQAEHPQKLEKKTILTDVKKRIGEMMGRK